MKTLLLKGSMIWKNRSFASWRRSVCIVLLVCSSLTFTAQAQKKQWDATFGGSLNENFTELVSTPDGGYIIGGTSNSGISGEKTEPSKGSADFWIVKTDASGKKLWEKTIGTSRYDYFADIVAAPDGGYLLGGSTASGINGDKSEKSKGNFDYWIVKLDANGNKLWDRSIGGNNSDSFQSLVVTADGGFLLGGTSFSGKSGDKSEAGRGGLDRDFWVVKINANGKKIWDKTITGDSDDRLQEVMATPDGGFLVGGNSYSDIGYDKTGEAKGTEDLWVVKLSNTGQIAWDRTFGGSETENLFSLNTTPEGGYLLGATSDSGSELDKSEPSKGVLDYWVIKIDSSGTKIWDRTIGTGDFDYFKDVIVVPSGGYLLGGNTQASKDQDKTDDSKGSGDYWIVKLNESGNILWDATIGGKYYDDLFAMELAADGGFVLGGSSASSIGGDKSANARGENDYWLVKIKEADPLTAQWDWRYGGSGADAFSAVIQTSDGGFLSGGYSNSGDDGDKTVNSRGRNDFWIVKSDSKGRKLWDKRYGGSQDDFLNTLIQTQDGGYLLGGSSLSGIGGDKSQPGRGERDYWVVKISANGVKQWDKRFGGGGYDELKQVMQLPSGSYILAGTSSSLVGGDKSQGSQGAQDYWVIKITNKGLKIWDKRYGGTLNDALEGLIFTLDGGFVLGGSSASGKSGDRTEDSWGQNDYWLVRITSDGIKLWDKRFGGTGDDNLSAIGSTRTASGNFFIAGHSTSVLNGNKSQNTQGLKDFWMLKINQDGGKIWDRRYGGNLNDGLRAILFTHDGGYLLAGRSESGISGEKTENSRGSSDYWIVKASGAGKKLWDRRFGGNAYDEVRTVLQTGDGGYVLGGRSNSGKSGDRTQPSQGLTDYWLVKVAPEANKMPLVAAVEQVESVVEAEPVSEVKPWYFTAYPNPASDETTIRFHLPEKQHTTLKVYDSQGREITTLFQGEVNPNQNYQIPWKAGNQAAGMYLLQLQTPAKRSVQKLILSK